MQEAPPTDPGHTAARTTRGRRLLLVLALVALIPFVLAVYFVATDWRPEGRRVNFGELVEPALPLPEAMLRDADGNTVSTASLRGRWVLLTVVHGSCTAGCRGNLWKMQQARLAQGKHMRRVERLLLVDSRAHVLTAALARDYPGTRILTGSTAALAPLRQALTDSAAAGERIYLVDPNGNLVLRYGPHAETSSLHRDLARLLRLSQIG